MINKVQIKDIPIVLYFHTNENDDIISSLVKFAVKLIDIIRTKFHINSYGYFNTENEKCVKFKVVIATTSNPLLNLEKK